MMNWLKRTLVLVGLMSTFLGGVEAFGQTPSPIQHQLQQTSQDTSRIRLYLELIRYFHKGMQYDSIYATIQKALPLARSLHASLYTARLHYHLGLYYRFKGQFDPGIQELKRARTLLYQLKDSTYIPTVLYTLGITYYDKGDYEQAIRQALNNMAYFEKRGLTKWIANTDFTLRDTYKALQDKRRELLYVDRYVQLTKRSPDPQNRALGYDLKASSYESSGAFALALPYRVLALKEFRRAGNTTNIVSGLTALAANLRNQKRPAEALVFLEEASRLSTQVKSEFLLGGVSTEMTLNQLQQNQYKKAQKTAQSAVSLLRTSHRRGELLAALQNLTRIQKQAGDYSAALASLEEYISLNDSLSGIKKTETINQIQAKYDLVKKESDILRLTRNVQQQQFQTREQQHALALASQQQRTLIWGIISLAILTGIIIYFLRQARIAQRQLRLQKDEIENQAIELQEVIQLKDQLFSIVGHDLRSPVASLKASLTLLKRQPVGTAVEFNDINRLDREVTALQHTLDNILYWSLEQQHGLRIILTDVNLTELVQEVLTGFEGLIAANGLTILFDPQPIYQRLDENTTLLVLRNLLHNAIKFTPAQSRIYLSIGQDQQMTRLVIADEGVGIDQAILNQFNNGRKGGTGLGLRLSQELMKRMGGQLHIQSQSGKGTTVSLNWPSGVDESVAVTS